MTSQDIAKKALRMLSGNSDIVGIILTQVEIEHVPYFMYVAAYRNEYS